MDAYGYEWKTFFSPQLIVTTVAETVVAIVIATRSVAAVFGRHGMPPPAANDTGTALGRDGSD